MAQIKGTDNSSILKIQAFLGLNENPDGDTTLKVGEVKVYSGGAVKVFAIEGGFADVTPEGLTILAEQASEVAA